MLRWFKRLFVSAPPVQNEVNPTPRAFAAPAPVIARHDSAQYVAMMTADANAQRQRRRVRDEEETRRRRRDDGDNFASNMMTGMAIASVFDNSPTVDAAPSYDSSPSIDSTPSFDSGFSGGESGGGGGGSDF